MGDLQLTIETDHDLGTRAMAEGLLAVLSQHSRFEPERFGDHEPLRTRYDPTQRESVVQLWLGKAIQPDYWTGGALLSRTKAVPYFGSVSWVRGQRKMNSVTITVPEKHIRGGVVKDLLALGRDIFRTVSGQYGFTCDRHEYIAKNMTGWWVHPKTGRRQGGAHHGYDRTRHLPGVYWANFFGPAYVKFFGEDRLQTAPAHAKERLDATGWLLLTAESPDVWEHPDVKTIQERVVQHLGVDAFFSIGNPDRPTVAPPLELSTSIGGYRGGVTHHRPIAQDYLRTSEEARWFIEHVLDLVARLRSRIGARARLDLSPESLRHLDTFVRRLVTDQANKDHREIVLEMAAYYGEVVRRSLSGEWKMASGALPTPIVVLHDYGTTEDPFVRVVKLLQDGDGLSAWYDFVKQGGEKLLR